MRVDAASAPRARTRSATHTIRAGAVLRARRGVGRRTGAPGCRPGVDGAGSRWRGVRRRVSGNGASGSARVMSGSVGGCASGACVSLTACDRASRRRWAASVARASAMCGAFRATKITPERGLVGASSSNPIGVSSLLRCIVTPRETCARLPMRLQATCRVSATRFVDGSWARRPRCGDLPAPLRDPVRGVWPSRRSAPSPSRGWTPRVVSE